MFILTCLYNSVSAQSKKVILVGFYVGNYNDGTTVNTTATQGVPCPLDSNSFPKTNTWFYDRLAQQAAPAQLGMHDAHVLGDAQIRA